MAESHIPSFGYSPSDFKATPFVFEISRIGTPSAGGRPFAHRHTYHHVLWLTQGSGVHVIDFTEYALRPPSVFFIAPHQVHHWTSKSQASGYILKISVDFFQGLAAACKPLRQLPLAGAVGRPVIYLDRIEQPAFEAVLQSLLEEYASSQQWQRELTSAYLQTLFLTLLRLQPADVIIEKRPQDGVVAQKFAKLLDSHLLSTRDLAEYARMLGISTGALNGALKRSRGRTAMQLMSERLLLEAKRRLLFSSAPVGEVGMELGFDDPAYFARFFRKGAGMSPIEFRRTQSRLP